MVKKDCVMIEKSVLLVLLLLIGVGVVFASVAWITQGGTSFSFNETDSQIYNITIDITDVQLKNVTRVNITLPTGFTFENNSNITNVSNVPNEAVSVNFSSIGSILSWTNDTIVSLINSSQLTLNQTYFAFNATASTPGTYNFIVDVILTNGTTITTSNVSVIINDTTAPTAVAFVSPGLTTQGANLSQNSIPIKITVTDEGTDTGKWLSSINISLYNYTSAYNVTYLNSSLNYTLLNVSSTSSAFINFTGLADGDYMINATVNDTQGNKNDSIVLNITLDRVAPTLAFSCDHALVNVGDTITCTCSASDATSGVSGAVSYAINPSTTSADNLKAYCSAVDYAGNNASTSLDYTVTGSGVAISNGGGTTYTKTYVVTDEQFIEGYTKQVKKNEKIRIKVDGKTHNVGVTGLTSTTATLSIFSTPQEATLSVGDERRFDVDADDYYDVYVKLNKIESNKADVTIKSIHEKVTAETIAQEQQKQESADSQAEEELESKNLTWLWIVIIVAVVLIGVGYGVKKKR